ncbi:MAG: hypothetical protein KKI12_01520 [Proteobacteria bacterium]|nr:hypothetical protein [Pseudomonadota bacterium]MBU4286835.1 hypothetical protein [Pseudomonadota bacterium]MBU4414825.1 hypothetical protein [Pseudomonadota bacterium]MCG2759247.1 hypothetical protein [Desulfobacteraceae bacterium]
MPLPEALRGDSWTKYTARTVLPLIIWCAKNGKTITYGQLDREIVNRGWGHHVMAVQYGHPAGTIGDALIETEEEWEDSIPPLNALIVNQTTQVPGDGVNWYLERYAEPEGHVDDMSLDEKRAIVEEVHADIFSYEYWDDLLEEYGLEPLDDGIEEDDQDDDEISKPTRGGWSDEAESEEHKRLKEFIANNPEAVGLEKGSKKGIVEYLFPSSDKADVVFKNGSKYLGVEVKSLISNDDDINRGIFQCVKYQSLLRAEQKALMLPPNARAVLVVERKLPSGLQNLSDILGIKVIIHQVNK